eukprot:TRINITY_DN8215_c0_g1_i1.p1 TRINITY_DN8215_c0_g1~~TRINITY_DN8215_c0_g1_i1.p1  ORF type:complete len:458 (+),score=114.25 TRINITY_DN8215_c0_g1_i1:57-1430(+)
MSNNDFVMDYPVVSGSRRKVAPGTGFSMTEWNHLCMGAQKARQRSIGKDEIKMHCRDTDMWMVIHGKVYDVTLFAKYHPGGVNVLLPCAGKDASIMFNKYHSYIQVEAMMGPFCLGKYDPSITFELPPSYFGIQKSFAKPPPVKKPWVKGEPLTPEIVASRNTREELWVIIYGKVYDVTEFQKKHPGGPDFLLRNGGKDCSTDFDKYHSQHARLQLADYYLGDLKKPVSSLLTPTFTAPPPKKKQYPAAHPHTLTLKQRHPVSHDTSKLVFSHTADLSVPLCGHVRLYTPDGMSRSYTPISVLSDEVTFIIKTYPQGKVSTYLYELPLETTVGMSAPVTSAFAFDVKHDKYVIVAGGTGVAPFYPLLEELAKKGTPSWVVCCNKTEDDILLRLEDFADATVLHHYSSSEGHITPSTLESFLPGPSPTTTALVCGPPQFNTSLSKHLQDLGYDVTCLE